jgi:hypothetical protein
VGVLDPRVEHRRVRASPPRAPPRRARAGRSPARSGERSRATRSSAEKESSSSVRAARTAAATSSWMPAASSSSRRQPAARHRDHRLGEDEALRSLGQGRERAGSRRLGGLDEGEAWRRLLVLGEVEVEAADAERGGDALGGGAERVRAASAEAVASRGRGRARAGGAVEAPGCRRTALMKASRAANSGLLTDTRRSQVDTGGGVARAGCAAPAPRSGGAPRARRPDAGEARERHRGWPRRAQGGEHARHPAPSRRVPGAAASTPR